MVAHMKPVFLTIQRKEQLNELAKLKGTTPAKLVDELISSAMCKEFLSNIEAEIDTTLSFDELASNILDGDKWQEAADLYTPQGWTLVGLHKGGRDPFVMISMNDGENTVGVGAGKTKKLGDLVADVAMNNGSGRVECLSGEFVCVRRAGRAVKISIEKNGVEVSASTLSGVLAAEFGSAMKHAARSAVFRAEHG